MSWFRTRPAPARTRRPVRLQVEPLDRRDVPAPLTAVLGRLTINNESVWGIQVNTDGGNDRIEFWDNGNSGNGNVKAVVADNDTGQIAPFSKSLQNMLAGTHVFAIQVCDGGGHNTVYYHGQTITPVRYVDFAGGPQNDEFYGEMQWGLGGSQKIRFSARGGEGDDVLKVTLQKALQQKSELGVGFEGGNGFDEVSVDAWSYSPAIQAGARLWAELAGYTYGDLGGDNNGNNVGFWYDGQMDGTLLFNLMGSGGKDWVSVNLWFWGGSHGTVGNATPAGARVAGGGSDDDMQFSVHGADTSLTYLAPVIEGGKGTDTLTLAQDPAPGFVLSWGSMSGIDVIRKD